MEHETTHQKKTYLVYPILWLIIILAIALRFYNLDKESIWVDELNNVNTYTVLPFFPIPPKYMSFLTYGILLRIWSVFAQSFFHYKTFNFIIYF